MQNIVMDGAPSGATSWDDVLRPGLATDFFAGEPQRRFDPDAERYTPQNAHLLAELSRLAYRHDADDGALSPHPRRQALLEQAGFRQVASFSADGAARGIIVACDAPSPYAALIFRGTEQKLQDFLHDGDAWPVSAFDGTARVHRGFERALNKVWRETSEALAGLTHPVFYAGHSLGAALATLAAVRLKPRAVYTFGSPRVGDARFVRLLDDVRVYRVVNGEDVVTQAPPEALGFRHVGEEHCIGSRRKGWELFDPREALEQIGAPPPPLAHHAPINYVRSLALSSP